MKCIKNLFYVLLLNLAVSTAYANTTDNQTDDLSPILPGSQLPFQVVIQLAPFQLPVGFHSGVVGVYRGLWVFIAGRTNGLHGFGPDPFPPDKQNRNIYVVNPITGIVFSRSLTDPSSGLSQQQIDSLTVTSPQSYQEGTTVYMTGGYGIDTASGTFSTKPYLTAIELPGIIKWVKRENDRRHSVAKYIRQISNPIFQIAGGSMYKIGYFTQLIFGQNFSGVYTDNSNGIYSQQVRRFRIIDDKRGLSVDIWGSEPANPNPNFRRRDLNILPVIQNVFGRPTLGLMAYAGVFTPQGGVWTVPVSINEMGYSVMPDPNLPTTFKQGMSQYVCASTGLYSRRQANMYNIFFGGMTYEFLSNGSWQTDPEIPFTNSVTTIKIDSNGNFSQYLMNNQYPFIASTQSNPGNQLLFGAGAYFISNPYAPFFTQGILDLDAIHKPIVIGYIVGGIQSTMADTNFDSDSAASPYVFTVTLVPQQIQ